MFIIDQISMIPNKNLQTIHKILREIFGYNETSPFVGKTTLLFGYSKQLSPVKS